MFANFFYFIIVLLIYSTYPTPDAVYLSFWETIAIFFLLAGGYALLTRKMFRSLTKTISAQSPARLDHRYQRLMTRQSILAVCLTAIDIYALNLPYFLRRLDIFVLLPTLEAIIFLGIFIIYLSTMWVSAYHAHTKIYPSGISLKTFVVSNISFAIPVMLPWFLLSGTADLIFALPFETPKRVLSTTEGEIGFFLIFLIGVALTGPAIIQKFWRCKPLERDDRRKRIENLCRRAGMAYADILYWPIFGGRMVTAGVMGLVSRFRYILITRSLFQVLNSAEIDAVIAHEIGHIKKRHLLLYLIFFAGYMPLSYAAFNIIYLLIYYFAPLRALATHIGFNHPSVYSGIFSAVAIATFLLYFRYLFGYFMRNFERQADTYVYTLFNSSIPLMTTLQKIADTSGQAPDRPNWHHFSISERIDFLKKCESDRRWIKRHDKKLRRSIALYIVALLMVGVLGYQLNFSDSGKQLNQHVLEEIILQEIEKHPNDAELFSALGDLYYAQNKYQLTISAYNKSLAIAPDNPQVLNNLAWLYATCENPEFKHPTQALELATRAAELQPDAQILDTLAESFYVNGMYKEAVSAGGRALSQAQNNRGYFEKQLKKFIAAADSSRTNTETRQKDPFEKPD